MVSKMRSTFHEELDRLESQTLGALDMVAEAVDRVSEVIEHQDIELAQLVIEDDDRIDGRYLEVHQGVLSLLARQAPVATDLRLIAALLDIIKHVERMGDQCVNICKLLPLGGNEPPTHPEVLEKIVSMAKQARFEVSQAKQAFSSRDVDLAADLVRQDEVIN